MNSRVRFISRTFLITTLLILLLAAGGISAVPFTNCGPFTDVSTLICPFVLELYYSGITAGTSATTFSPNDPVTRGQMAIFTSTALDLALARSSRRAALGQWWTTTPHYDAGLGTTAVGSSPFYLQSDGADLWVSDNAGGTVTRVRASDGRVLGTWSGATMGDGVLVAMGRVFVAGATFPGSLYMIDPTQAPGGVTTLTTTLPLGGSSASIAFDGNHIWMASQSSGSLSIITPGASLPWTVSNVTAGFSSPTSLIFDGVNMWVTDPAALPPKLYKLDALGSILQSVTVGSYPGVPIFDGHNIWMPITGSDPGTSAIDVVAASTGVVQTTLTGNGLNGPIAGAFDGARILVANINNNTVSLWKAADLTPLGSVSTGAASGNYGVCSDGVNFWIALDGPGQIGRF